MTIRKLLIANRGEIAVRIIRAARELGIETVQVISAADREMLAARLADQVVEIGPAHASKSYLNRQAVLDAALATGADAIHPGYGFLSENADFAQAVTDAGLIFVGPDAATIRNMGDKASARRVAAEANVPTVPGSTGVLRDLEEAARAAEQVGYPVMIKATAGGGGRGIRIAETPDQLEGLFSQATAEATAAFGEGGLYLERLVRNARHIEVQILGDGDECIHLYERECSLQRRRQKVWEEAPAHCLSADERAKLCASAVRLATSIRYKGAGTLEYLFDPKTREFFFIEMNTRVQVEHPITEAITGVDIVREGILIAGGKKIDPALKEIRFSGHAIEVRICAEDVTKDFRPSPGVIANLEIPGGPGVRFDTMVYPGYVIPPFYDSLLGKLIVWDRTREAAIDRLGRALRELRMDGVPSTAILHQALARDPALREGQGHTAWLEEWLKSAPLVEPAAPKVEEVA